MSYVLGIDGGGSKTTCILMNCSRQLIGRGEAGASNYQSIGIEAAKKSIETAIKESLIASNMIQNIETQNTQVKAICLGLAGVGRPKDIEVVKNIIQDLRDNGSLPITWNLQPHNIIICHDALIALVGGIGHNVGIVVAAGTGSIIFGRNSQGKTKRVGGWGHILGDEGSAYKIAIAGMQAALKSYDGREINSCLLADFQQHLELANIEDLVDVIYRRGWDVKKIAALAPIVDRAAAKGDQVANKIIDDAVEELFKATSTVIEAIFQPGEALEVVTTGSVWGSSGIREKFVNAMVEIFPGVEVILPRFEPAYGACLQALGSLI
ncbi:N-acetylglucosamine kinase [Mastigocoleus testarum]|uniref:ATPase n=1 Tax=Mastigocoleus testarum BC008 TaxID=371196 RepID=A0A0V7ZS49_9CYAN|nr:BadF/BadG/BcrA/BcrD ATPase family protein [Mastigocoleus testarum]KST67461.1 ATPase [Mastigocoleus testarum BC008]